MFEELKDYKVNFDAQKEAYKHINRKMRELLELKFILTLL